jgi:hypothetical protein
MGKQKRRDILLQQEIKNGIAEEQLNQKFTKVSSENEQKDGKKKPDQKKAIGKLKVFLYKWKDRITYVSDRTLPARRQIRLKLVTAFFVPAILIIILGIFSYTRSQSAIVKSFEKASIGNIENSALY